MHFQFAAAAAVLACAGHVAAEARAQPYQPVMMAMPGMSLMRRDTSGYKPEQQQCGEGNTCSEACGATFSQCKADKPDIFCFNPAIGESCCPDGSGNSCEQGFYCTHDTSMETWCCPDDMDLEECAAAYKVTGGLETQAAPETTTSVPETTTCAETTEITSAVTTEAVTTTWALTSAGSSSAWSGSNSTYTSASLSGTYVSVTPVETDVPSVIETGPSVLPTNGAGASAVSMLLLAAAGVVALF